MKKWEEKSAQPRLGLDSDFILPLICDTPNQASKQRAIQGLIEEPFTFAAAPIILSGAGPGGCSQEGDWSKLYCLTVRPWRTRSVEKQFVYLGFR